MCVCVYVYIYIYMCMYVYVCVYILFFQLNLFCLFQEDWDFLQLQVALLYNSETSGIPLHMQVENIVLPARIRNQPPLLNSTIAI